MPRRRKEGRAGARKPPMMLFDVNEGVNVDILVVCLLGNRLGAAWHNIAYPLMPNVSILHCTVLVLACLTKA